MKSLGSHDRREYQRLGNEAYSAQNERTAWLKGMFAAAAKTTKGSGHLVTIVMGSSQAAVRQLAAEALFNAKATREQLEAITSLWELPATEVRARRSGAKAQLLQNAAIAFDRLSPSLPDLGLLYALDEVAPNVDPRWLDALVAIVETTPGQQFDAMAALAHFDPDPRITTAVLNQLGDDPIRAFMSPQALALLARGADGRAVPYLLRALENNQSSWHPILEALATANDATAIHALRRWHARVSATMPTWPGAAKAAQVIAQLEALGPVPDEPPPLPIKAVKRKKRKLHAAPKVVLPRVETIEAQRADLVELLRGADLAAHAEQLIRPAIQLVAKRSKSSKIALGKTRIGGCPDLPRGVPWPSDGKNTFGFVAQFDLSEVAPFDLSHALPDKGLLSFFVMDEGEGGYLEHAKVLYFENVSTLARAEVPKSFDRRPDTADLRDPYPPCEVILRSALSLPSASHSLVKSVLTEAEQKKYETLELSTLEHNLLLGYRQQSYDDTPADVGLLLQMTSDDQAAMEWGDVETLSFMIRLADLAKRDFSQVVPRIGD